MSKDNVSEALLALINEKDVSYGELSKRTGIPKSAIQRYATGQTDKIPVDRLEKIVDALAGSVLDVMGWNDAPAPEVATQYHKFNIIGEVAAGYEHFAEYEDEYGSIDIPDSWLKGRSPADYFILRVSGDSMYPQFQDGDLVLVLKQSTMNYSGQIGVVVYDDNKATLKKIEYVMGEDWMRLVPINPAYPPVMVTNERLEHCRVLGIAKKVIRDVR